MKELNRINKKYRHFKGNIYIVLEYAKHSETEEELVIYKRAEDELPQVWVRPKAMFFELVPSLNDPAKMVQRFEALED